MSGLTVKMLFRYVGERECAFIEANGYVLSASGVTYFSNECLDSMEEAQRRLALYVLPEYRIGAIPEDWLPETIVHEGYAEPRYGQPGGGHEIAVRGKTYVFQMIRLKAADEGVD